MARWYRARRLLDIPPRSRVLDLGCAFGFGTRLLQRRYETYGHDLSRPYIERARATAPLATFTCGAADAIPYPEAYFDAILLLDVLEHVPDANSVVREITRVLRPSGCLVLSVPNRGVLGWLDSLNMYHRLLGDKLPPPTDDPSWHQRPRHEHYALSDIRRLFEPRYRIREVRYSGLGVAEVVNLLLLLLFRALFPMPRAYAVLQYLYFGTYLVEDMVKTGRYGYHLMARLEKA